MTSSSRADSAAHSLCLLRASLCVSLVSCSLLNELLVDDEVGDLGDVGWASAGSQEGVRGPQFVVDRARGRCFTWDRHPSRRSFRWGFNHGGLI